MIEAYDNGWAIFPRIARLSFVAVLALVAGAFSSVHATAVTLRFDATVGSVFPSVGGVDLPFTVAIGDVFSGTLTLEPDEGGPTYSKAALLRMQIDSVTMEAADLDIRIENDVIVGVDLRGRIADPINTPDADIGGTSDNILVYFSELVDAGAIIGDSNLSFRPYLAFSNEDTLLNSTALLDNPGVWNGFSFRELSLSFYDVANNRDTYVGAYIGNVTLVPEPNIAILIAFPLTLLALLARKMKRSGILKKVGSYSSRQVSN